MTGIGFMKPEEQGDKLMYISYSFWGWGWAPGCNSLPSITFTFIVGGVKGGKGQMGSLYFAFVLAACTLLALSAGITRVNCP